MFDEDSFDSDDVENDLCFHNFSLNLKKRFWPLFSLHWSKLWSLLWGMSFF